jgi:hypothetical protein
MRGAHVQAASFRLSTVKIFTPLVTLAILIQQNPNLSQMRQHFPEVARKLMEEVRQQQQQQQRSSFCYRLLHISASRVRCRFNAATVTAAAAAAGVDVEHKRVAFS